jgi:hypothetical protein
MKHLIRSVELKLERASAQTTALEAEISNWVKTKPFTAECSLREEKLGFRLVVSEFPSPSPLHGWGLQVGECVHNLRSALDNRLHERDRIPEELPWRSVGSD